MNQNSNWIIFTNNDLDSNEELDIQTKDALKMVKQLYTGCISGVLSRILIYPLDRLKMVYQVKYSTASKFSVRDYFREAIVLAETQGIRSFWNGCSFTLLKTVPNLGITFLSFESYNHALTQNNLFSTSFRSFISGSLAGVTAVLVTYPMDVWSTRLAVSANSIKLLEAFETSRRSLIDVYKGLNLTLLGVFLYSGVSFYSFSILKEHINTYSVPSNSTHTNLKLPQSLVCGGIAGLFAQMVVYPIDTVRKVLQSEHYALPEKKCALYYDDYALSNVYSTFKHIARTAGVKGFYRGISINCFKVFLSAALAFSIREHVKQIRA